MFGADWSILINASLYFAKQHGSYRPLSINTDGFLQCALEEYVESVVATAGFWARADDQELDEWNKVDSDDFHPSAIEDIYRDISRLCVLLDQNTALRAGEMMEDANYSAWELGGDFWLCRVGSGAEYTSKSSQLNEALERATTALGSAAVEIGSDGLVRHMSGA